MTEKVIELSIEETNKLRSELGLKPLRLDGPASSSSNNNNASPREKGTSKSEEVLELSVEQTNGLRAKLGLKPLRSKDDNGTNKIIHKPATNDREAQEAAARIEQAKLQREVQQGIVKTFGKRTLAEESENSALSWAAKMRQAETKKEKPKKNQTSTTSSEKYEENDLEGMQVSHKMSEIEAGSTAILTLADTQLLDIDKDSKQAKGLNEAEDTLENVNLAEHKKQKDGLNKKRMLEMGMGRSGGYAGFDDEEFEELGGTLGPSSNARRNNALLLGQPASSSSSRGFRIGLSSNGNDETMTDFDAIQKGKAISLVPTSADVAASDYMTVEEEQEERAKRKLKKDGTFKKKKKMKEKKDKKQKKRRRRQAESDDDEEENIQQKKPNNLLEQLEETANPELSGMRLRRQIEDDRDAIVPDTTVLTEGKNNQSKRARYDEIMAKGNERTRLAFQEKKKEETVEVPLEDDEPDDSFLNAALAKARRLNRLREMNTPTVKGADAVAMAVKQSGKNVPDVAPSSSSALTFAVDDTREFTRAIQARAQQEERKSKKARAPTSGIKIEIAPTKPSSRTPKVEDVDMEEEEEQDVDIEELAKEVKTDDNDIIAAAGLDGATTDAAGVGRGLASFVSMLKHTGEISGKNAGKEELRGRAKDEKNYQNYEKLDLSQVVNIGRNATDKDREFARREIKLEYRDKHGRLLTQKEAYRDLCYQFHGHGASKNKEEKRLRQIGREQAEARLASRQMSAARDGTTAGTLGALKATQKATGKAFIVHKT
jgi:U4/U6.U5 tri-snRNP-associated protein 1